MENAAFSFVLVSVLSLSVRWGLESVATVWELLMVPVMRAGSGVNVRLALAGLQNGSPGSRPRPSRLSAAIIEVFLPSPHVHCLLYITFLFLLPPPPCSLRPSPRHACTLPGLALSSRAPCMWLKSEAGAAAKPQDRNGALAEENRPLFWVLEVEGGR